MIHDDPHVSDQRWDRLLAGDLAADVRALALDHADRCPRCAARHAELERERDAFAARPPLTARPRPRRAARGWWAAPAVLAAAAAVAVLVRRADPPGGERAKGVGPILVVAAGPGTRLAPVTSGDPVSPGDSIQVGYTAAGDGFGALLARDGSGAVMPYVPSRGDAMVPLPAGTLRSFPESTVLDATAGDEDLVVLWCAAAHPLGPLLAELGARGAVTPPAGCTLRRVVLTKRAGWR